MTFGKKLSSIRKQANMTQNDLAEKLDVSRQAITKWQSCHADTVILTGSVTTLDQAAPNFALFEQLYGIRYIIPENATFATAIGAALCSLKGMDKPL